jgi:hypothetical protein
VQNKDPILVGKLFQNVEGSTWHVETKTRNKFSKVLYLVT